MTTFTTKGKIVLLRDGVVVSQHTVAEEAYERALNGPPGVKYVVRYPDREIVVTGAAPAPTPAPAPAPAPVPLATLAFPGAEGFGRNAKGGRGGVPMFVTNLNPNGPGSLQAIIDANGPRIAIFRVGGTIDYTGANNGIYRQIAVKNPYLTIAGQTAPGDGVMIKGAELCVKTHDVVIRHLRVRPGPDAQQQFSSTGALETDTPEAHDIIYNHCSASWAPDDLSGGWAGSSRVTFQSCILANPLRVAEVQQESKCAIWGSELQYGDAMNADMSLSLLGNLIANCNDRAPHVACGKLQMSNNVVYNIDGDVNIAPIEAPVLADITGNYFLRGPDCQWPVSTSVRAIGPAWMKPQLTNEQDRYNAAVKNWPLSAMYLKGNFHNTLRTSDSIAEDALVYQGDMDFPGGTALRLSATPVSGGPALIMLTAQQAFDRVLNTAGHRVRDVVDAGVVANVRNGTSPGIYYKVPFLQWIGGSWPTYQSGPAPVDSDNDGVPDAWAVARGFSATAKIGATVSSNGYTHLENYLNELAGDVVPTFT